MYIIWAKKLPDPDEDEDNRKNKVKGHILGHIKSTLSDRVSSDPMVVESLVNYSKAHADLKLQELYIRGEPGLYFTALSCSGTSGQEWDCSGTVPSRWALNVMNVNSFLSEDLSPTKSFNLFFEKLMRHG